MGKYSRKPVLKTLQRSTVTLLEDKRSQDFSCEACGCSMHSALMALTPNSNPSAEDHDAKELAQQINFKADSSSSRQASESGGAEGETSAPDEGGASTPAGPDGSDEPAEAPPSPAVAEEPRPPAAATPAAGRPLSPRQRRAQQHSQRAPSRPVFPAAPRPPLRDGSHAGSVVLIVVLALFLAALIFRRVYLANEFKFDYEL